MSLAVPTDARQAPPPARLSALDETARAVQDGEVTDADVRVVRGAWTAYRDSDAVPELSARQMTRDLDALGSSDPKGAALRVMQNTTALRLRYEPVRTVDLERFSMWARQLGIDAAAGDAGAVAGDVTSLELAWERLRDDSTASAAVTADLHAARDAADREDTAAAGRPAPRLGAAIAKVQGPGILPGE
ncbi:hypothetical protein [Streptomyces fulvoviolaceus]|uniref:hypothetical protein n=1 Tax=Streptomyces fulvoviolaceus TaxID=285535 RepID=UPI000693B4FE|nr:hypothetical protein [Streptomyces fulvoviolaceus]